MPSISKRELAKIVKRLEFIFQKLDGTSNTKGIVSADEFLRCQNHLSGQIVEVRNKIQQKMKLLRKESQIMELKKVEMEIRNLLGEIDITLDSLKDILRKILDSPKIIQKVKNDRQMIVEKFEELVRQLHISSNSGKIEDQNEFQRQKVDKLSEMKINYKELRNQNDTHNEIFGKDDPEDESVLQKWKAKDREIDRKLDDVVLLLDEIKSMNSNLGREIQMRDAIVDEAQKDAFKANKELEQQNKSLAAVLRKFRSPGKVCMDICLVILLLGLIGVIVMLSLNGK